MKYNKSEINRILKIYNNISSDINNRITEFESIIRSGSDEDIMSELVFCIFTPQSKARKCWESVVDLKSNNILYEGNANSILPFINNVRFKNRKSQYAADAINKFKNNNRFTIKETLNSFSDTRELRNWFAENIRGYGYKEASHFLRNIGLGEKLAILDRHILKNLVRINIIDEIPKNITKSKYIDIENKIEDLCKKIKIRMDFFDLVLWYSEAGEIFK